mmetsp:Transcript_2587/g.5244  ORF Transcript_2587/g.5244 Transcript_2587/m.5244 type:complete len:230 (+) Transcript_2587:1044-1733(+)
MSETYWKRIVVATHPRVARTMGMMMMIAPGSSECGARTFDVKPATTMPGMMPPSGGTTMKRAWKTLTVMLMPSTLGTRKWKGILIMPTKTSNACVWAFLRSAGEPTDDVNIPRTSLHSAWRISAAFSTWPMSNCITASRQPLTAFTRFPEQRTWVSVHGAASSMGKPPNTLQVFLSVSPKFTSFFSKASVVILSQLPSSMACALSRFMATANSWTKSSACASTALNESM